MHFTESGIIQKLESLGIGRPSTYSNIIQSLYQKKYVEKKNITGLEKECITIILDKTGNITRNKEVKQMNSEKGKLKITQIGIEVWKYCYEHFNDLFEYEFTRNMEVNLDDISEGNIKNCGRLKH